MLPSPPKKQQLITQVIGSKLTPQSTGVSVSAHEWKQWMNKPNHDKAREYGVTISQPDGTAVCWSFFYIIDDHTELASTKPDLCLSLDSSSKYAMCNKCGKPVLCSNPKNGHTSTIVLIRHCQKHDFPTHYGVISDAKPKTPPEAMCNTKLKQQSIFKSAIPVKHLFSGSP